MLMKELAEKLNFYHIFFPFWNSKMDTTLFSDKSFQEVLLITCHTPRNRSKEAQRLSGRAVGSRNREVTSSKPGQCACAPW